MRESIFTGYGKVSILENDDGIRLSDGEIQEAFGGGVRAKLSAAIVTPSKTQELLMVTAALGLLHTAAIIHR